MKLIYLFFIIFIYTSNCQAQKYADNWYFGHFGYGLNFSDGCEPELLTDGELIGFEGCATISDNEDGELLFYTNSETVWDKNHVPMPNGSLNSGGNTVTQVLSFAKPGSLSKYYIFTSEIQGESGHGMRFHCVDMSLNGGLGDLFYKDSLAYSEPVTEKITAVRHSNGTDIWVISHVHGTDEFIVFLVDEFGVSTPMITSIGKTYSTGTFGIDAAGEIKASPDGTLLATVTAATPDIELFDFNSTTGEITNARTLIAPGGNIDGINSSNWYSVSFSPDNSKLYAACPDVPAILNGGLILQFDLTAPDELSINSSMDTIVASENDYRNLKIGPNGKIYVTELKWGNGYYLGVINAPNELGAACNYETEAYSIGDIPDGGFLYQPWGLNNLIELEEYPCIQKLGVQENNNLPEVKTYPNPCNNFLTIEMQNSSELWELEMFSLDGRLVKSSVLISASSTISLGDIMSGKYIIKLTSGSNAITQNVIVL